MNSFAYEGWFNGEEERDACRWAGMSRMVGTGFCGSVITAGSIDDVSDVGNDVGYEYK